MIDAELDTYLSEWERHWTLLPAGASLQERRILSHHLAADMALPRPGGVGTSVRFVRSGGRLVPVRVDRFTDASLQPCLLYIHGGGFTQGSPATHADITMQIAAENRQTVLGIDYSLAPENPFPAALHECRDVAVWAFENAAELGIDPQRIAVGGDSAGANLAAALTLALRGTPHAPAAQLLAYPCLHFEMSLPSYRENADAPLLPVAALPAMISAYCPDPANRTNPLAAPLHAESFAGLPPAFIAVADIDPLRDDGYAYAERLRAAGVAVEFHAGKGLIHGYLRAMKFSSTARQILAAMASWLAAATTPGP